MATGDMRGRTRSGGLVSEAGLVALLLLGAMREAAAFDAEEAFAKGTAVLPLSSIIAILCA